MSGHTDNYRRIQTDSPDDHRRDEFSDGKTPRREEKKSIQVNIHQQSPSTGTVQFYEFESNTATGTGKAKKQRSVFAQQSITATTTATRGPTTICSSRNVTKERLCPPPGCFFNPEAPRVQTVGFFKTQAKDESCDSQLIAQHASADSRPAPAPADVCLKSNAWLQK